MAAARSFFSSLNEQPRLRDVLAAAAYLAVGLAAPALGGVSLWRPAVADAPAGVFVVTLLLMVVAATQRSTAPLPALAGGAVVAAVDVLFGGSLGTVIVFADLVYCAFRYGSDRAVRVVLVANAVLWVGLAVAALLWADLREQLAQTALQGVLIVMVGASWGWSVRSERTRTHDAAVREHAEATRRMRRRIAHDLHDRVANQIAVAGLNIEAALLRLERDGAVDPATVKSLEQATRGTDGAHRQLRQLIAVLTSVDEPGDAAEPRGNGRDLDALVPEGRALRRRGDDLERVLAELDPTAAALVDRALRELITNAVKHGAGDIDLAADATAIRVSNHVADPGGRAAGNGIGIVGAATLLEECGASVSSGRTDDRWIAEIGLPEASRRAERGEP